LDLDTILSIVPIAIFVITALATAAAWLIGRDKRRVDMAAKLTETAMALLDDMQKRLDVLEQRNHELQVQISSVKTVNSKLRGRVSSLEHDAKVYVERAGELEVVNAKLRQRVDRLLTGIDKLIDQINKHDSRPDWRPNE